MSGTTAQYPAYKLVRSFIHFALRGFYQQIRVVGLENVPLEGQAPVIFAGNHPNSLLDPAIVICSVNRMAHFAAKDVLFQSAPLRVIMNALGVVPISRRKDHGGEGSVKKIDNSQAFAALNKVLISGRSMGIFPEGISHDQASLSGLKTGAARIGLQLVAEEPDVPLVIVPVGLTYIHRNRMRSRVLVQFGHPLQVHDWLDAFKEDPREAARDLTDHLDRGLRALTINAPDWETVRVLDGVRRLYQPPRIPLENRVELARRFNEGFQTVKDKPEVIVLYSRIERYLDELDSLGLSDRDLDDDANFRSRRARAARNLMLALVWLPLALPGFLVFLPLGQLVSWAGVNFAPRTDVIQTSKFVLGVATAAAAYMGLVALTTVFGSIPAGIAVAVALPLSAVATLKVLERGVRLRRLLSGGVRSLMLGREVERLRAERRFLEAEVIKAVERLLPEDMERLYERTAEEIVDPDVGPDAELSRADDLL